jgi:hypothetical protein
MGIIKDDSFKLSRIYPQVLREGFESSQNRPVLIRGINVDTGVADYYVIKPAGANRMYNGAAMRELIASLLALELELQTPEPVIVEVDDRFIELTKGTVYYSSFEKSQGLNFGSKYIEGHNIWKDDHFKTPVLFSEIQKIFIFDIFIENSDRNKIKPNLMTNNQQILIFDHEIAFSFADILLYNNATPWKFSDNDIQLFQNHLFYNFLHGKEFVSESFVDKMGTLDYRFWEKVESLLPKEWMHEKYPMIKNHLLKRISELEKFKNEIKRLLI